MNIRMMRFIDRWIGIPLCFLLSIYHLIAGFFRKGRTGKNPEKILFIGMSEMGSIVLAYSAIKKARETFPDASLYFMTLDKNGTCVDILSIIPHENVYLVDSRGIAAFLQSTINMILKTRREGIDAVIDIELFSRYTSIISYLSGAGIRAGFYRFKMEGLYRGDFLTHRVQYNPHIHIAFNFLSLVRAVSSLEKEVPYLKGEIDERDIKLPAYHTDEDARERIWDRLMSESSNIKRNNRIIIFNIDIGSPIESRRWPLKNYFELGRRILSHDNIFIILIGLEPDADDNVRIQRGFKNDRCLNMTGKTTMNELMDILNIGDMLITSDSGPAHFASMTPIRILVLFGPETPVLYRPLSNNKHIFYSNFSCSPCLSAYNHRESPCRDNKCLQAITPEEVYEIVRDTIL